MTLLPTVRRQLLQAAHQLPSQRAPRRRLSGVRLKVGHVLTAALLVVPILIAGFALATLSHRAASPTTIRSGRVRPTPSAVANASTHVSVRVARSDQYCVTRAGYLLRRCPTHPGGLIRLGGPSQQWLVIFSFGAPRSTAAHGRTYYYFTATAHNGCPNADQFGAYSPRVLRGQTVVQWAAFDEHCPGPGHGTISCQGRSKTRPLTPVEN